MKRPIETNQTPFHTDLSQPDRNKFVLPDEGSDAWLEERVGDMLTEDRSLDNSDIQVHATAGIVTLTGSVFYVDEKSRAHDCAKAVAGVVSVQNRLTVRQPE